MVIESACIINLLIEQITFQSVVQSLLNMCLHNVCCLILIVPIKKNSQIKPTYTL